MTRVQWIGVVGVLAAALGAGVWFGGRPPPPPPVSFPTPEATPASIPATLTVHVAGAVRRPGLVEVPGGGRVADAVAAAGGVAPDADLDRVNLAAPVGDGQQIVVPRRGDPNTSGAADAPDGMVRVNQATVQELEALPGIGTVTATRIVAYREEHGAFAAVEDLLDVPGIGEGKLAALRDLVAIP